MNLINVIGGLTIVLVAIGMILTNKLSIEAQIFIASIGIFGGIMIGYELFLCDESLVTGQVQDKNIKRKRQ